MGRGNRFIGRAGEDIAFRFLARHGYKIMAKNHRTFFGEIDAVAKKDGVIVFIEVKTRLGSSLGPPYLSVTKTKARHIIRNALLYLAQFNLIDSDWRVDVVAVKLDLDYRLENIEIIENAVGEDQ